MKLQDKTNNNVILQAVDGAAVTASDSTILQAGVLYVGTGGTVKVRTRQGTDLTFANVQNGSILPIMIDMVYSTGTVDASDMIILW